MRVRNWRSELARGARLWRGLRLWLAWLNGDVAYLTFVAHLHTHHPERATPTRAEFYRMEVERRWNSVRRCC
jgi:uncharacterized short protein YbdD (DUF466 family)